MMFNQTLVLAKAFLTDIDAKSVNFGKLNAKTLANLIKLVR